MSPLSVPFPSCFKPSLPADEDRHLAPPSSPPLSANPTLISYLYQTQSGFFYLTWSRSILGRSLHIHFQNHPFDSFTPSSPSISSASFNLHIKPFIFKKNHGFKKLSRNTGVFWNLGRAKFGSGAEPKSGFYVAVVVDGEMALLVGDSVREAFVKSKAHEPKIPQFLVMRREHVIVNRIYATGAKFGGKMREIRIDSDESRLCFSVDNKKVLQIKRLKWKFRGNERVEVDGIPIHISWDVYNWFFLNENNDGHAVFIFKFEEEEEEEEEGNEERGKGSGERNLWTTQHNWNLGMNEWGKMAGKSFSTSSMSSSATSFGGSSSVMEWSSTEENDLIGPIGFSLLVYAWKR